MLAQFGGAQFSTFKSALVDLSVAKLGPIGAEMKRLLRDPVAIDSILADGAARAQKIAGETMKAVKDIVGFGAIVTARFVFNRLVGPAPPWQHFARRKTCMPRRRRSYEAGHKPKLLVVVDDTAECDRAVYFAAGERRASAAMS